MTEFLLCGSSNSWLLNYETLWTVTKSDLLISMLETLTQLVSIGLCYWREEGWLCPWWKSTFTILRLLSSSNWIGALTLSLLPKLPMRKFSYENDSFDKVSFFLGWVYLYKCVKSFLSVDLAILRPTLSYWHVGGLNQLTSLIGQFLIWNQGHQELHNDVRPKTQQKASVGFEPEPSNSNSNEKLKDFWPMSNWKCISIL